MSTNHNKSSEALDHGALNGQTARLIAYSRQPLLNKGSEPHADRLCDNLPGVLPIFSARLSTKGQLILPKDIRTARAWGPGTEFTIEETEDGILLRPSRRFPRTSLDEVVGCLKYKGKAKTLAQMDAAIGREVMRRHDRGRY